MTDTNEPAETTDDDDSGSVIDMLIDAASERRVLLNALYRAAHGSSLDRVTLQLSVSDFEGTSAEATVAEMLVTLLLTTDDDRAEQAAYLDLAERLTERGLCDNVHFNDVLMLLLLDRGCDTGFLPSEFYVKLTQYASANHPEWLAHLEAIDPDWTQQLN